MVKREVLDILKQSGGFSSGESISRRLGVSRAAVWKAVQALRREGYEIESVTNRGYRLASMPDVLSADEISACLDTKMIGKNIFVYKSVESTNMEIKKLAGEGGADGSVILAETQTSGVGRMKRSFYSPDKVGIWMSLLLRPKVSAEQAGLLTVVAAVAVKNAVDRFCDVNTGIKWTNDILLGGRKLCGILTEMATEAESGSVHYAVVGIGVNVNQRDGDFPADILDKAVSLRMHTGKTYDRSRLAACILNEFERLYFKFLSGGIGEIIDAYRKGLCMLNQRVKVVTMTEEYEALAVDVDESAALIVQKPDGSRALLKWGEVMVRGLLGYA